MRIGIIQFPGSNCERETMLAVKRADMEPVEFLWNEGYTKLREMDGYVIAGGFSYEDRSRAGIIAALDPLMQEIKAQSEAGKPILGICNGAQILVEAGLVPGLENNKLGMALTENKRIANGKIWGTGYYNAWIHMRLADEYQRNAFTRHLAPSTILQVPIAHGEGRFVMSAALRQEVEVQGLNVFQYCDAKGNIVDTFPINPNGSLGNMAAVSNKAGNVMAMMPHPERTLQGDPLFQSMRDYIAEGRVEVATPLYYYPRRKDIPSYKKPETSYECIVELMITDNHALTVQQTLQKLGIPVRVKRKIHWEIHCDSAAQVEEIKKCGVLFNERKECVAAPTVTPASNQVTYLVRAKEDVFGQQTLQTLQDHFSIPDIKQLNHGVLWQVSGENANIAELTDRLLATNVIFNPYAHDYYHY